MTIGGSKTDRGKLDSQLATFHFSTVTVLLLSQDQSAAASFNTSKASSENFSSSVCPVGQAPHGVHAEAKCLMSHGTGTAHP